jgi:hypothetical protein
MRRTYQKNKIAHSLTLNLYLAAIICMTFSGLTCTTSASDEDNANLNNTYSSQGVESGGDGLADHAYSQSDSAALDQSNKEKLISGIGYGELLLTFTVNKVLPVFSGRYSYDIAGIHVPPISSPLQVDVSRTGYSYILSNIYIPRKPNNFTVSVTGVKTMSIGLQKLQGSYENSSTIWEAEYTRTWVSTQVKADDKGIATTDSDLLSPGIYHAKIFGDAAEDVSQVNLTMTVVKKLVVNGPYNLSLNTTGFPEGDYSIKIKALNGTFGIDEMLIEI